MTTDLPKWNALCLPFTIEIPGRIRDTRKTNLLAKTVRFLYDGPRFTAIAPYLFMPGPGAWAPVAENPVLPLMQLDRGACFSLASAHEFLF